MIDFLKEFWEFLKERKKFWLLPIIIVLGIFGILTKPSVKALKYRPVPPTSIGVFLIFLQYEIFLLTNLTQSPVEKFFLAL